MKIVYICSDHGSWRIFDAARDSLRDEGYPVEVLASCFDRSVTGEGLSEEMIPTTGKEDFILVNLHHALLPGRLEQIRNELYHLNIPAAIFCHIPYEKEDLLFLLHLPESEYEKVHAYLYLGGYQNMRSLLIWALNLGRSEKIFLPDPVKPPTDGIYHPGWMKGVEPAEYRMFLSRSSPVAGILFWQGHYLSGNLDQVDKMIGDLEEAGFETIPVYCKFIGSPDPLSGFPGIEEVVRRYFMKKGSSCIDLLVIMVDDSRLPCSSFGEKPGGPDPRNLLILGVPVVVTGMQKGLEESVSHLSMLTGEPSPGANGHGKVIHVCMDGEEGTKQLAGMIREWPKILKRVNNPE